MKKPEQKYPECDKLERVSDESQNIGEFIDWLHNEKGYCIANTHAHQEGCFARPEFDDDDDAECGYKEDELQPIHLTIEKLLAEYFDVDMDKVEKERRKIIEDLRKL